MRYIVLLHFPWRSIPAGQIKFNPAGVLCPEAVLFPIAGPKMPARDFQFFDFALSAAFEDRSFLWSRDIFAVASREEREKT